MHNPQLDSYYNPFKKSFSGAFFAMAGLFFLFIFTLFLSGNSFAEVPQNRPLDLKNPEDLKLLPDNCRKFISESLPKAGWSGGFIMVPENWKKPMGPKIQVFYYFDNSVDTKPSSPILFLNGGPFSSYQSSHEKLSLQIRKYNTVKNPNQLFMMDQRGTGCSVPNIPVLNEPLDVSRFVNYASDAVARDAEQIRKALFPRKKWKLMGQSYGGYLTAKYITLFPQSVAEAHLHGPALFDTKADFYYERIKKQNDVMKKFTQYAGENLIKKALAIVDSPAGAKLCAPGLTPEQKICGRSLFDGVTSAIGQGKGREVGSDENWKAIKEKLMLLVSGTENDINEFVLAARKSVDFYIQPSCLVIASIYSQELKYLDGEEDHECAAAYLRLKSKDGLIGDQISPNNCRLIKEAYPKAYKDALAKYFTEAHPSNQFSQKNFLKHLEGLAAKSHPIPVYIYTGELDSLVPKESLQVLLQSKLVRHTHFPESGHAGWLFEPIFWQNLTQNSSH